MSLFSVGNHHDKMSGTPPAVDWDLVRFCSYFASEYHEQWVCWVDNKGVHVAGGTAGWETIVTLRVADLRNEEVHVPLVITGAERLWMSACFTAIRGGGLVVAVGVKG